MRTCAEILTRLELHNAPLAIMSSSPASDGPIQQKLETAQAVRQADDADVYEMQEGAVKRKWQGTEADRKEMSQLGRVQELRVSLKGILGDILAAAHHTHY